MASILAVLIVIDFMFLDDSAFIFEPDIKVRCRLVAVYAVVLTREGPVAGLEALAPRAHAELCSTRVVAGCPRLARITG